MSARLAAWSKAALAGLPNLLVLAVLAVIGIVGARSEWRIDKLSEVWKPEPRSTEAEGKDADGPNAVPLRSETPANDWCEHQVPAAQCTICHPEIAVRSGANPDDKPPADSRPDDPGGEATTSTTLSVREQSRDQDPHTCQTHRRTLEFESAEAIKKAGITLTTIGRKPMSLSIVANGVIDYDQTKLAHLSTRAPGNVWRVYKQAGQHVVAGDVLGLIDAGEVGRAKAEFLQALRLQELKDKNLDRLKTVESSVAERQFREAEAAAAEARIRLFNAQQALVNLGLPVRTRDLKNLPDEELTRRVRFLGLPEGVVSGLDPVTTTANLIPLIAPFEGTVISRDMVEGEVVSSSQPLFAVADVRRLWMSLDVRQEDANRVAKGQPISFRPDGSGDLVGEGAVAWISTEVDDRTRTVRVRAEIPNPKGLFRARTFGTGRILIARDPYAVVVPNEAVQWDGCCFIVFVLQADGKSFMPRKVRLGIRSKERSEVTVGVLPGEVVALTGSHVLKGYLFKSLLPKPD